jgi:hypothetical protein
MMPLGSGIYIGRTILYFLATVQRRNLLVVFSYASKHTLLLGTSSLLNAIVHKICIIN